MSGPSPLFIISNFAPPSDCAFAVAGLYILCLRHLSPTAPSFPQRQDRRAPFGYSRGSCGWGAGTSRTQGQKGFQLKAERSKRWESGKVAPGSG